MHFHKYNIQLQGAHRVQIECVLMALSAYLYHSILIPHYFELHRTALVERLWLSPIVYY